MIPHLDWIGTFGRCTLRTDVTVAIISNYDDWFPEHIWSVREITGKAHTWLQAEDAVRNEIVKQRLRGISFVL